MPSWVWSSPGGRCVRFSAAHVYRILFERSLQGGSLQISLSLSLSLSLLPPRLPSFLPSTLFLLLCIRLLLRLLLALSHACERAPQMVEFATFDRALINLVLISMGEFSAWEELYLISPIVGSAFFFSYVAVVTVLMMNITLSIVVESFVGAAAQSDGATSVFADAFVSIMIDVHLALKVSNSLLFYLSRTFHANPAHNLTRSP